MKKVKLFRFGRHLEEDGILSVVEGFKDIPFEVKRVFWIGNVAKGAIRGDHASYNCEFAYVCVCGNVCIETNDGLKKQCYRLSADKADGLYLSPDVWMKAFHFSDGAVLLVLGSKTYIENRYYESYDKFMRENAKNGQ